MKRHVIPFIIINLNYTYTPDQSDEQATRGCALDCIVNLDDILEKNQKPIIERRCFDKNVVLKAESRELDIGCLYIEYKDDSSLSLQVSYTKEIYDAFLPIILNTYYGTDIYSMLMQRHRDEQINRLFD